MPDADSGADPGPGPDAAPGAGVARATPPERRRGSLGAILLRNEWFKARKRLASWVTFGGFAVIAGLGFGSNYVRARGDPDRAFALPSAWPDILAEPVEIASFFAAILLVLLVASEFSWRTARQNVIDGLSKEQWFWGKTLLLPVVALVFMGAILVIGGGFALAGTDFGSLEGPLIGTTQVAVIGAGSLRMVGYGSLALAAAMAIRGTGAAMGVWFIYVALGEPVLLTLALRRLELVEWIRYLPVNVFNATSNYMQWDGGSFGNAVQRAVGPGGRLPQPWETESLLLVAGGWIAFFVIGSFLWFRRRDL